MGNFKFILEYNEYIKNIDNSNDDSNDDLYIYNEIKKRTKFNRLTLTEGLIKTYPIDKSISILKKRFPELEIELEEDGEIFIKGFTDILSKYLPIITNIGYFISKLTIDGNEWIIDYDNDTKPIAIFIEPKYDYEVAIPNILFHASPLKFKDKIT